ncbi:TetR/AcrR family transcriptional regulator [Limnohabitans sp. 2KL-51]|uniref:TetR/AcrR family transcriptional regulator n=1 Tax=Limnohabitans sp. 2KL-51 TaxID=1977911 RepID=UPI001304B304|nr:TetR/AcrR family transcriptional regulator [Limnohabitans sp. 2KL-51]
MAKALAARGNIVAFPGEGTVKLRVNETEKSEKSARRQQREIEILSAAREVFLEKGFERAAVSEIAARVGVVEGLVFRYFPTKRDLLNEVLRELYEPLITDVGQGFARITGLRGRLRFIVWRHLRFYTECSGFARLILHEVRTFSGYQTSVLHGLNVCYTDFLRQTIQQAIVDGEVAKTVDYSLVRSVVYGGIEHLMWPVLFGEHKVDVEKLAATYTDQVLNGLPGVQEPDMSIEDRLERLEKILNTKSPAKKERKK